MKRRWIAGFWLCVAGCSTGSEAPGLGAAPAGNPPFAPAASAESVASQATSAASQDPIAPGAAVRVLSVGEGASEAESMAGLVCLVGASLRPAEGLSGRYTGELLCGLPPKPVRVERAALELLAPAPTARGLRVAGERAVGGTVGAGAVFRVLEVHAGDLYFPDAPQLINTRCNAGERGLHENEPGYWGGEAFCGEKKTRYFFFKVAIEKR